MSVFHDLVNDVARGERALVIVPERLGYGARRSTEARVEEAAGLAEAIGVDVVAKRAFRLRQPRPATLLGKGQVEEIAGLARENGAGLLIVDALLTPVQQKSLEEEVGTKVIDRTSLILEIFGERAATAEGGFRSSLPISIIRQAGWSEPGPISNASAAASASSVVRAKRRSRPTAG